MIASGRRDFRMVTDPWPACRRRQPRVRQALRAISRTLPGFIALSVDVSAGGLQLRTRLPLDVGEELWLSLDFPDSDLLVHARVRVVWSRAEVGRYAAGCEFLDTPEETLGTLQQFLAGRLES